MGGPPIFWRRHLVSGLLYFPYDTDGTLPLGKMFLRVYAQLTRFGLWISLVAAALVAFGYVSGVEAFFRPIKGGPGTHPLTLICAIILSVAFLNARIMAKPGPVAQAAFGLAAFISAARLVWIFYYGWREGGVWATLTHPVFPIETLQMGANTAVTVLGISVSQLLRGRSIVGFWVAILSPLLLVASVVGYAYLNSFLYGHMSPVTVVLLFPSAMAAILSYARRPGMRYIFGSGPLSKFARRQLAAGIAVPFLIGLVLTLTEGLITESTLALFATSIIWFIFLLLGVGAWAHDRTDFTRRQSERDLALLSITDQLTGCLNRHGAEMIVEKMDKSANTGVILIDLDHFKTINDSHGHGVGDLVLRKVGGAIKLELRQADVVARWGGEEFLVFLHDVDFVMTKLVAERIRDRIRDLASTALPSGRVTASLGVTLSLETDEKLESAIIRADQALYQAKTSGRDRVVIDIAKPDRMN